MKGRKKHRVSALKPYLIVLVCLLIELHYNSKVCCLCLFTFSNLGVRLIYGCCLYMDFYSILVLKEVFLERETEGFALHRRTRVLLRQT